MKKSNLIGGVGKTTPFLNDGELGPVLNPNATVQSQTTGTSAEIAQEQIDANQGPTVGGVSQYEIDYSTMSQEDFETAVSFAPIAGEVIDAKNTLVDLYKGDYTGAALNAAGFLIPFVPGTILKKGAKEVAAWARKNGGDIMAKLKGGGKIDDLVKTYNPGGMDEVLENQKMEFMNTASDKDIVSSNLFTQEEKAEILGSRYNTNAGGVSDTDLVYDVRVNNDNSTEVTDKIRNKGRDLDNYVGSLDVTTDYGDESFDFVGYSPSSSSGKLDKTRPIVEVTLPTGKVQKFYKSSGSGKKAGSAGNWYPLESQTSSGWWSKEASYGSYNGKKVEGFYEDAAGNRTNNSNDTFISVHEQLKRQGVDPDKAFADGSLKLDKTGYDFHYGSEEYKKISDKLDSMPDITTSGSNYTFSANQKNVFSSTSADSKLKNTYRNKTGNNSTAIYENADGVEDVVITAIDDNNYVAFSKGDGPDGEWTSKMEVSTPGKFKQMLQDATKHLPEGAILTEKTSISADGLSVWSKFDGKGWKPTGKTKKVYLAKLNAKGDHDKVLFTTKEAANKKIAELKKANPNINYTIGNGPPPPPGGDRKLFINLELPMLEKVGTSNTNATGGVAR
jgi:hypothetical protein